MGGMGGMGGGTDESVAKLSARLLEGWTMLSETCPQPGCTVPLTRTRDNTEARRIQQTSLAP